MGHRKRFKGKKLSVIAPSLSRAFGTTVSKNIRDIKKLKQGAAAQKKKFDLDITSVVTSNATVVNLSNIAQGDDQDNREGNRIMPIHGILRFSVEVHASATQSCLRILIFIDKEQNGVDPTAALLLQSATDYLANLNRTSFGRFQMLHDRVYPVTVGNSNAITVHKWFKKLKHNIYYDASAAADASNRKGAMFLMALSNEATNGPTLDAAWRMSFTG